MHHIEHAPPSMRRHILTIYYGEAAFVKAQTYHNRETKLEAAELLKR
jgi:hypothetical protein